MVGIRTSDAGGYDVPRVYLTPQAFVADEGRLSKFKGELKSLEKRLSARGPAQLSKSELEKIYADLLSSTARAGIGPSNLGDFKAKRPNLAEFLYSILFRVSDGLASILETRRAIEVLMPFIEVSNGDVIVYDPVRVQDLEPLGRPECAYKDDPLSAYGQERYNELLSGLTKPANACHGVRACENPVESHYNLKAKRDNESGAVTLSGEAGDFERLDVDVFCGIDKRDSLHLIADPEGKFATGSIARCAEDTVMALRWKASHPQRCSLGKGALVLPPRVDTDKAFAKRIKDPVSQKIPEEMMEIAENNAPKLQTAFVIDISGSMRDDVEALRDLLSEIIAVLQTQDSEVQIGVWHISGGDYKPGYVQDLPMAARENESLAMTVTGVFDQILASIGGGEERIWKTLADVMNKETWDMGEDVHRAIFVLSDEWSNAQTNAEPLQVAKMAKEKGIEIKIRGPASIIYELARLAVDGIITEKDYDEVVVVRLDMEGEETRLDEGRFSSLLDKLDADHREKLAGLYDDFKFGRLKIQGGGKIDLTQAVLDSEDERMRLQMLRGTVQRFREKQDPEYFDLIAGYLKDEEELIRKEAVGFFIATDLPNSLRPKYAPQLAALTADENAEVRKLAVMAVSQTVARGISSKEKDRYVEAIAKLLKDHSLEVRRIALHYLGSLAPGKYLDSIVASLGDPEPVIRKEAVEIIRTMGFEIKERNIGRLLAMLKDESRDVRDAVRMAAKDFVSKAPEGGIRLKIASEIVATFEGDEGSRETLDAVFKSLSESEKKLLINAVAKQIGHPDPKIRENAIHAAEHLIPQIPDIGEQLVLTGRIIKRLSDSSPQVQRSAYMAVDGLRDGVAKKLGESGESRFQVRNWFAKAGLEDRKLAVEAMGVIVPAIENKTISIRRANEPVDFFRYDYAGILADEIRPPGFIDSALMDLGLKKRPPAEYEGIVQNALENILPTLFPDRMVTALKDVRAQLKPFEPKGEPVWVLAHLAGAYSDRGGPDASKKPPPAKPVYNLRDYFEEAPPDKPLYVNHRFIHYSSERPWILARQDLQALSSQPAPTEEAWMCVEGETPAGERSHCYEIGIGETAGGVRPYIESSFTRGAQEEFSKVTAMSEVHFHPKGPAGTRGDEYPSHIDFNHLIQQALVSEGLGYPKDGYSARVVTSSGVFTMKPNFKEIEDHFEEAGRWVADYILIFARFILEGPEFQGLTQAEKSGRFALEVTARLTPYVDMRFEPIEPAKVEIEAEARP